MVRRACTCTRESTGAGTHPAARMCSSRTSMCATDGGTITLSTPAAPVKSSMKTCRNRANAWLSPGGSRPSRCSARRRAVNCAAQPGAGCSASN
eukprot:6988297-Prymnesium_polylepis.1